MFSKSVWLFCAATDFCSHTISSWDWDGYFFSLLKFFADWAHHSLAARTQVVAALVNLQSKIKAKPTFPL